MESKAWNEGRISLAIKTKPPNKSDARPKEHPNDNHTFCLQSPRLFAPLEPDTPLAKEALLLGWISIVNRGQRSNPDRSKRSDLENHPTGPVADPAKNQFDDSSEENLPNSFTKRHLISWVDQGR